MMDIMMELFNEDGTSVDGSREKQDQSKALVVACKAGNPKAVQLLLDQGANPNFPDQNQSHSLWSGSDQDQDESFGHTVEWHGYPALHAAASRNHCACLEALLKTDGISVDWRHRDTQSTALLRACSAGHLEAVRLLLHHGADPNLSDHKQYYPLHFAARSSNIPLVQLLIEHGVDLDVQDSRGNTPLHLASADGSTTVVNLLLEHGAKVNLLMKYGVSALALAAQCDNVDCLLALMDKEQETGMESLIDLVNDYGETPLFYAAQHGRADCIEVLLARGADPNAATTYKTGCLLPLQAAICFSNDRQDNKNKMFQMLAPVTDQALMTYFCRNDKGPFYQKVRQKWDCIDIMDTLIMAGYDINVRRYETWGTLALVSPLWEVIRYSHRVTALTAVAVIKGAIEDAMFLLRSGACVDARSVLELPPLVPALDYENTDLVNLLLDHGCQVNVYHPKLIGNVLLVAAMHYPAGLSALLRAGAEAETLFLSHAQARQCDSRYPWNPDTCIPPEQEDLHETNQMPKAPKYGHGWMRRINVDNMEYPVPCCQFLDNEEEYGNRTYIKELYPVLYKLMQCVTNVSLDETWFRHMPIQQKEVLLDLTERVHPLKHFCRLAVRRHLTQGHGCINKSLLDKLCCHVPQSVLQYVAFEDLQYAPYIDCSSEYCSDYADYSDGDYSDGDYSDYSDGDYPE